jgi:signal peptidase I
MSASPSGNGDAKALMTDGHPAHDSQPDHAVSARSGRNVRGGVTPPGASAVRLPQERDYRLRGLGAESTGDVPATPTRTDGRRRRRRGPLLVMAGVLLAVAVAVVLLVQTFVSQPFSVPGNAMTPTLQAGDRILVVKSDLEGPIHSGQIVVFRPPQFMPCTVTGASGGALVLRVVALPGQTIWSVGGTIFVDGRPLREQGWYNARFGQVGSTPVTSTTLAQGQYYVMADNRSDACDSRVFGAISKSSIIGEGVAIVVRNGHLFIRTL